MYKKVLSNYKDRLINFSGRNQTLCRSKLYSARAFDVVRLNDIDKKIIGNIISSLVKDNDSEIKILPRGLDTKLSNERIKDIEKNYIKFKDKKVIKEEFSGKDLEEIQNGSNKELTRKMIKILEEDEKNEIITRIHSISKNLDKLFNEIDAKERETGLYELYLGYPFVEGKLLDSTTVRAPLFLFPSSIYKKDGEWFFKNLNKEKIYINKVFLMACKDINKVNIESIEEEYEEIPEFFKGVQKIETYEDFFEEIKNWGKNNNILIDTSNFEKELEIVKDYKKESYKIYKDGELVLKNHIVLGQFSVGSNGIYKDFESMLESDTFPDTVKNLLFFDSNVVEFEKGVEELEKFHIKEEDSFFVTELDYSQEKAVKIASTVSDLVIYGPPGTGKSQVIANIVSDNLARGKKILVVSEKRTALDVVYKRLEKVGINHKIGFVHDAKTDRQAIMDKIIFNYEANNVGEVNDKVNEYSDTIQIELEKLDRLARELHLHRDFGTTLYRLYTNSKLAKPINQNIVENFEIFKDFDYYKINKFSNKMLKISKYLDFDNSKKLLFFRKSFSDIGRIDEKMLIDNLHKLNKFLTVTNFKDLDRELSKYLLKINFDSNWIALNSQNSLIYENIDRILSLVSSLETKLSSIVDFDGKIYGLTEIENIPTSNSEVLLEKILNSVETDKSINKIRMSENLMREINEMSSRIISIISSIDVHETWKNKNRNKDISSAYSRIEKLKLELDEYNKLFFLSFKRMEIKRTLNSFFPKLKIKDISEKINYIFDEKKKNEDISSAIKDTNVSLEFKIEILTKNLLLGVGEESSIKKFVEKIGIKNKVIDETLSDLDIEVNYLKDGILEFKGLMSTILEKLEIEKEIKKYFNHYNSINESKKIIEEVKKEKDKVNYIIDNLNKTDIEILDKLNLVANSNLLLDKDRLFIEENRKSFETLLGIKKVLSQYFSYQFFTVIYNLPDSYCIEELIKEIEEKFNEIKLYDDEKRTFNGGEMFILNDYINNQNSDYIEIMLNTFYICWIEMTEKKIGKHLSSIEEFDELKVKVYELIQSKKQYIPQYINSIFNEKIKENFEFNRAGNEIGFKPLMTEATKKRKRLSLRRIIESFYQDGLFDLLPCWLITPEIVSEILPFKEGLFDIVIFDEASQIFVEKSLPTIYRAKSVVVAGDDKQLKPTSIGIKRIDEEDNENTEVSEEDYFDDTAITEESLLDLAKQRYKSTLLSYHYRSKFAELINFSNYAFYNGKLVIAPNIVNSNNPPIEVIKTENGRWEDQSNFEECKRVYSLVKEILISRDNNQSIGIVTFNAKQQDKIKEYLDDICENDIEFRALYEKEKIRYDGSEDQSLFVKNIENVQGDERDIIIFSTAYAKDNLTGRVASRFGTLSQEGGENRLNVAISRAKEKIYIITSIEPEELNVENSKNNGPKLLKKYLQYARAVSSKNTSGAEDILNSLTQTNTSGQLDIFDSPFEEEVCIMLREKGYNVHTQIGDSGYRVDMALYDEKTSNYIMGIECDGAMYHSSPFARERDIYRQKFLEMRGWKIHRIWSKNWWENPHKEIEKIHSKVKNIKSNL